MSLDQGFVICRWMARTMASLPQSAKPAPSRMLKSSLTPLPTGAAQNRRSVFTTTYPAVTEGSGTNCHLFSSLLESSQGVFRIPASMCQAPENAAGYWRRSPAKSRAHGQPGALRRPA